MKTKSSVFSIQASFFLNINSNCSPGGLVHIVVSSPPLRRLELWVMRSNPARVLGGNLKKSINKKTKIEILAYGIGLKIEFF
jgi:hypothetical protein